MADEFDAAVSAALQGPLADPAQAARVGMQQAVGSNPELEAELQRVATKTGVPISTVRANPEDAKRQAALGGVDFDSLAKVAPSTARLLADVDKAKVSHDEVGNLTAIESAIRTFNNPPPLVRDFYAGSKGKLMQHLGQSYLGASTLAGISDLAGVGAKLLDKVNPFTTSAEEAATLYKNDPAGLARFNASAAGFLPRFINAMNDAGAQDMLNLSPAAKADYAGLQYATTDPSKSALLSPMRVIGDAIRSLPTSLAMGLSIYLTKGAAAKAEADALAAGLSPELARSAAVQAAAKTMGQASAASEGVVGYAQQANQTVQQISDLADEKMAQSPAYQSLIAQGYSPAAARQSVTQTTSEQAGLMAGIVDAATNHIGGQFLGKILTEGGKLLLPRIGKGAINEALVEFVQSGGEQIGQNLATQKNVIPGQDLGEGVLESMVQGLAVGGLTGGAFSGFAGHAADEVHAKAAEQGATVLGQIMQYAAASKVRERDAATFQGFMQNATANGPLEKLYVNPKELEKAGLNLAQLAEVAPSAVQALAEAYKTGTDAAIDTAELATRLPGTPLEAALLPHLKTDPGGFSQVGAQEFMANQGEAVRAQVEKVMAEHQADDAFKASMKAVEQNVLAQLKEANRFTEDVNAPYAAMWAAFFGVQAARLGVMPEALFQRFAPAIAARGVGGLEQRAPGTWFHGTSSDVQKFNRVEGGNMWGRGYYLTDNADTASGYATGTAGNRIAPKGNAAPNVMPVRVAPGEVFDMSAPLTPATLKRVESALGKKLKAHTWAGMKNRDLRQVLFEQFTDQDGANAILQKAGFIGIAETSATAGTGRTMLVFDAKSISSDITGKLLAQAARGSFNPDTNTVALLQAADLSTFLHESGHFFLEVLGDLASEADAPQQIKDDFATFLKWTGVESPEAWHAMTLDQQREHHENFARGFEAYLFEGKAPSIELQGIFQRFRAWLLNVYHAINALNINLTPEVRSVFDRMLATTDQIRLAEDLRGYEALFKNKPEGMTADEWAVYQIQANEATQQAITDLEARSLRDMKWLANAKSRELAKLQNEAKARRTEIERQVRAEVDAQPVYQAMAAIKEQRHSDPADREAVKAWTAQRDAEQVRLADVVKGEYLATPEGTATKGIQRGQYLARNKRAMANEVERLVLQWEKNNPKPALTIPDADLAALAALHGFSSADELRKAINAAQPRGDVIEGMTDQRMLERHGDLVDDRAMERAAEKAIHNDARLRFTATEANALNKAIGKPALLAKAVRQFAAGIIARTRVRDLRPGIYTAAEKRAALDAAKAVRENKLEDAAIQKRNQLINGYAAQEAISAQEEAAKIVEYLGKFNRESVYKTLDGGYVEQIHNLLERFDLRTGQSLTAIDKRTSLAKWLAAQEEAGFEPDIPPELADEAQRKSYKNMTMEELRGLRDTVKQIEHLGRLKHKLLTAKDQRDYEAVRDLLVTSINDNAGNKHADNRTRPTALNAALRLFNGYLLEHRKLASLVREIDGFKDGGPMWEYIARSMNHAGDTEATMRAEAAVKLAELVKPLNEGGKRGGKGEFFPAVGKSFNREERIGIALNMGNAGNLQRLLDGEGWSLQQLKTITDTLSEADWHFVQGVWNFLETYRPLIGAKEKRVYGKEPAWVEPMPLHVQTADGKTLDLQGGYYPIKYDTAQSGRAETLADAEAAKQMLRGAFTSSTTRRSFTKARSEEVKGRPLMYSTDALFNGVNEIIHDLSWHEWLIDANRLMRSKSIDGAIRDRYGAQVVQQFKSAIRDIAAGEFPATHAFEKGLGTLRAGTVIAGLGLNIMNSVINVQGFTQSIVRIGPKWSAIGIGKFAAGPLSLAREVNEKSPFMANRALTMQREVNEIQSLVRGKSMLRQATDRILFLPLTMTQQLVDLPSWWGAYQKALDAGEVEDRAVSLADQAVVDAQSGGQVKDLAAIQRGGPFLKLWTTFYGFFSSTYNLTVESTKATNFTSPLQVVKLATDYLLLWTIPALLGTLLKNAMTGGDWDEDKLAKNAVNDQIGYLMGFMVGTRELAGAVQAAAGTSEFNTGYGGPAGARFMGEVYKLAQQAYQGDIDAAFLKALDNVGGILLRFPAAQINRSVEGAIALKEGNTSNPLALVAGAPPKH